MLCAAHFLLFFILQHNRKRQMCVCIKFRTEFVLVIDMKVGYNAFSCFNTIKGYHTKVIIR